MKKLFIIASIAVLLLAGCGKKAEETFSQVTATPKATAVVETSKPEEKVAEPKEVAPLEKVETLPTEALTDPNSDAKTSKFEQFESDLEKNNIAFEKVQTMATLVGGAESYRYVFADKSAVELYLFDKDADAYKTAIKTSTLIIEGMNLSFNVDFNDDIAIYYKDNPPETETISKIFTNLK